ncbi:hypothetical protein QYF36_020373 [Acer negundo]|nr:hypothetical protein QYF36_020373 [Acer negundo]
MSKILYLAPLHHMLLLHPLIWLHREIVLRLHRLLHHRHKMMVFAQNDGLHDKLEWIEKRSASLMIVASLVATFSLQAITASTHMAAHGNNATTSQATTSQAQDDGLREKLEWIEKMSASLIIVASLVATVSFQFFFNPLGGFVW